MHLLSGFITDSGLICKKLLTQQKNKGLKFSKEIITGISTVLAIGLLVTGINFLKGNSFFGGDDVYYAYFPNSGGVAGATSVYVDGVEVGKVLEVKYLGGTDSLKKGWWWGYNCICCHHLLPEFF